MNPALLARAAKVVPHTELLVNIVRLRVRQLVRGARPLIVAPPGMGFADLALSEIAEKKLTHEAGLSPVVLPAPIINFPTTAIARKAA